MTNREWLNSLSDNKLAKKLYEWTDCYGCPAYHLCRDKGYLYIREVSEEKCTAIIRKWLRAQYNKEEE